MDALVRNCLSVATGALPALLLLLCGGSRHSAKWNATHNPPETRITSTRSSPCVDVIAYAHFAWHWRDFGLDFRNSLNQILYKCSSDNIQCLLKGNSYTRSSTCSIKNQGWNNSLVLLSSHMIYSSGAAAGQAHFSAAKTALFFDIWSTVFFQETLPLSEELLYYL